MTCLYYSVIEYLCGVNPIIIQHIFLKNVLWKLTCNVYNYIILITLNNLQLKKKKNIQKSINNSAVSYRGRMITIVRYISVFQYLSSLFEEKLLLFSYSRFRTPFICIRTHVLAIHFISTESYTERTSVRPVIVFSLS